MFSSDLQADFMPSMAGSKATMESGGMRKTRCGSWALAALPSLKYNVSCSNSLRMTERTGGES